MVRVSSRVILRPKSEQYWATMRKTLSTQAGHFPMQYLPGEIGEHGDISPWGYGANLLFKCKDHEVVYAHEEIVTKCSTFIKELLIMSDAKSNADPFGRTIIVLPDITSEILKQALRVLYLGEETFSYNKTPWDTTQAIIDVFERIFKIKWNLMEPNEGVQTRGSANKSMKRKNDSPLERDKKGKFTKKALEESNEPITNLYLEARKNVLKMQSYLSNIPTGDEVEVSMEDIKPNYDTTSMSDDLDDTKSNDTSKGEQVEKNKCKTDTNDKDAIQPDKTSVQSKKSETDNKLDENCNKSLSKEGKSDAAVADNEKSSPSNKSEDSPGSKKLKQTKMNEFIVGCKKNLEKTSNNNKEDIVKDSTITETNESRDIDISSESKENDLENKASLGKGETESKPKSSIMVNHQNKEISLLGNYSQELHRNILVLKCYKCNFSTNIDQDFKSHMEEVHKTITASKSTIDTNNTIDDNNNLTMKESGSYKIVLELITDVIMKKIGVLVGTSKIEEHVLVANDLEAPMDDSAGEAEIVALDVNDNVINIEDEKSPPEREKTPDTISENSKSSLEDGMKTIKDSEADKIENDKQQAPFLGQQCTLCSYQCKLRMQLSKHMKNVH